MRDMNKNPKARKHRLSETQRDVVYVLRWFELQGKPHPVASTALFSMVNGLRPVHKKLHASNFRASCNTLVDHGYLEKFRGKGNFRMAFKISQEYAEWAAAIHQRKLEQINSCEA